jgi:Glycosyltransferase family 87
MERRTYVPTSMNGNPARAVTTDAGVSPPKASLEPNAGKAPDAPDAIVTRIRRGSQQLLRPVLIASSLLIAVDAVLQPFRAVTHYRSTDWIAFAVASRLVHAGAGAALYTQSAQVSMQATVVGGTVGLRPYGNPPLFAFLVQPIGILPLRLSTGIWVGLLTVCLSIGVALFAGLLPRAWGRRRRAGVAMTSVALIPSVDALAFGQLTPLVMPFLALSLRLIDRRRDSVLAGLLLAVLAVKPQFIWLVPVVLIMLRARRTLLAFSAGCVVWVASTVALVGIDGTGRWIRDFVPGNFVGQTPGGAGLPSILASLGVGSGVAVALAIPFAALAMWLMWLGRDTWRRSPAVAVALAVSLSALCSPHAFDHDIALVGASLVLLARERTGWATGFALLMDVAFFVDISGTSVASWHLVSLVALAAVASIIWPTIPARSGLLERAPLAADTTRLARERSG